MSIIKKGASREAVVYRGAEYRDSDRERFRTIEFEKKIIDELGRGE